MIERRKGTTQSQRTNHNLLNINFKIDDRSFEDLLAYIISYVDKINFYTTENVISGTWRTLIEQDPVIYMIKIIKEPVHINTTDDLSSDHIQNLLDWYARIEEWHARLSHLDEKILVDKIGNVLSDVLQKKKNDLVEYLEYVQEEEKEVQTFHEALKKYTNLSKKGDKPDFDINEIAYTFKKIILHVQDFTKHYLQTRIFAKDNHMPNNAMYIAFVILYQKIQEQLNTIETRHLDFYYKDILQQELNSGIASEVMICFDILPKGKSAYIPESTQVSAGKLFGSKKNIIFETNTPILAHPIQIEKLQTLYFNKSPYIKIGTDDPIISSVIKGTLLNTSKKNKNTEPWPLFGADEDTLINSELEPDTITEIGIMIGSQVLFLEEGRREIDITFTLEESSAKNIFWKLLDQMSKNQGLPLDVVFNMVFEKAFLISYTSIKGWEAIPSYELSFDKAANTFTIRCLIDNISPPVTVCDTITEHSKWPMIKILFDEYAPIYAYSFFKEVSLQSINIEVEVIGIKNLSIYNNIGKVSLNKPFVMFGPKPDLGGYLMLAKSELFKKELKNLAICIEWDTIPRDFGGFDAYYEAYEELFTNDSFKVNITALSNGYWFPREEELLEQINLFDTEPCKTPEGYGSVLVAPKKELNLEQLGQYELSKDYRLKDPIRFDMHTQNGFFKLTLAAPKDAFGKDVYQKNYTRVAQDNARNQENLPLPNKPFIPKVRQITVNYNAKDVIYFDNAFDDSSDTVVGDYIHITPFGTEKIVDDNRVYKNIMVPNFKGEGYLYMQLKGVKPNNTVSLFFDLQNMNPVHINYQDNIDIQYKKIAKWTSLSKKHIISDGTNQFTKSGIIEIMLPDHMIDATNYELRILAYHDVYKYPVVKGIYPNAVIASSTSTDEKIIGREIPENSITKPVGKIPEVAKIIQPAPSFGGKLPDSPNLFYTEISERLRHKDRAVTMWDYERLILEYFHEVVAVKCTNLNQHFKIQAGKLTLIVLSKKWSQDNHHYLNLNQLDTIRQFVKKKCNSFIKVKVMNPKIEWLLVNSIVEFHEEDNGGYFINELNRVLNEYLCPLTFSDKNTVEGIGTVVIPRMLKSYVENLYYIKSVKKIEIEHIVKKGLDDYTLNIYKENQEIKPTTPWSMLVPKSKHNIYLSEPIVEDKEEEIEEIQHPQVGVDFIIAADDDEVLPIPNIKEEEKPDIEVQQKEEVVPKPKSNTILSFTIK